MRTQSDCLKSGQGRTVARTGRVLPNGSLLSDGESGSTPCRRPRRLFKNIAFYSSSCASMGPDSILATAKELFFTGLRPRRGGPARKKIAADAYVNINDLKYSQAGFKYMPNTSA